VWAHLLGWVQAGGGGRSGICCCGRPREGAGDGSYSAATAGYDLSGGGVTQRAALEWCQGRLQEGGWIIAADSRAVLSNVLSQRRLTPHRGGGSAAGGRLPPPGLCSGVPGHCGERGGRPPCQTCGEEQGLHTCGCPPSAYEMHGWYLLLGSGGVLSPWFRFCSFCPATATLGFTSEVGLSLDAGDRRPH